MSFKVEGPCRRATERQGIDLRVKPNAERYMNFNFDSISSGFNLFATAIGVLKDLKEGGSTELGRTLPA